MASRVWVALAAALCLGGAWNTVRAAEGSFDTVLKKVRKAGNDAGETDVIQLLRLAKSEGRPVPASLVVKTYLSRRVKASPKLLALAADIAALAGDYRTASARYKTVLRTLRPGDEASESAASLYKVLVQ